MNNISRRDYFSGLAMQSLLREVENAKRFKNEVTDEQLLKAVAIASIQCADHLITALDHSEPRLNSPESHL